VTARKLELPDAPADDLWQRYQQLDNRLETMRLQNEEASLPLPSSKTVSQCSFVDGGSNSRAGARATLWHMTQHGLLEHPVGTCMPMLPDALTVYRSGGCCL